jgi:hypothetical protein
MRVVNNIDREMLKAEWENWLLDENTRCKQVERILRDENTNAYPEKDVNDVDVQKILDKRKAKGVEGVRDWYEAYCDSCRTEWDGIVQGRKHLAFG